MTRSISATRRQASPAKRGLRSGKLHGPTGKGGRKKAGENKEDICGDMRRGFVRDYGNASMTAWQTGGKVARCEARAGKMAR